MATTPKRLYGSIITTSLSTLYTVPASTTTIVKNITLCNMASTDTNVDITLGNGVYVIKNYTLKGYETVVLDLSVVMNAGQTIAGYASQNVHCIISGVEVA